MKFIELPEHIHLEAAKTLSRALLDNGALLLGDEKRMEQADKIADTIRGAYLQLCSEQQEPG